MPALSDIDSVMQSLPPPSGGGAGGGAAPSYPMVPPHPAPDNTGAWTNLSDEDYRKFNAGIPPPATAPSMADQAMPAPRWSSPELAQKMAIGSQAAAGPLPDVPNPEFPTAGKQTGYVANVGAGTSRAVAGMLGMPVDLTTALINVPRTVIGAPPIREPFGGSGTFKKLFGLIGANPDAVAPATQGERLAGAAAEGATAVALPGGIASRVARAALPGAAVAPAIETLAAGSGVGGASVGAAGGVGGEIAQEVVPEPFKPLANLIGNVAAGGAAVGVQAAVRGASRLAGTAAEHVVGPLTVGEPQPIINPETGQPFLHPSSTAEESVPVVATPRQVQMAGRGIARAAGMPAPELAASLPTEPNVAGSQLTMGQRTGNLGLLNEERRLRNLPTGRALFTDQEAKNDLARVAALDKATKADASQAASQWFRSKLTAMQAESEAIARVGTQATGAAAENAGLGAVMPKLEDVGEGQRAILEGLRQPAKAAAQRALNEVDKDGTLAVDVKSVGEAARAILKDEVGEGGRLHGAESAVLSAAAKYSGVEPFKKLRELMGNISEAMREIAGSPGLGRESKPFRRMAMLMDSVQSALSEAAGKAIGDDATESAAGARTLDRLQQIQEAEDAAAPTGITGGGGTGLAGAVPGGGAAQPTGGGGGLAPSVRPPGGPGAPGSAGAVEAGAPTQVGRARRPESLVDFIIARGGVKPDSDLLAMDADKVHYQRGGRLLNPNGDSLNRVREEAIAQGFFPQHTTDENAVKEAIRQEIVEGKRFYRPGDIAEAKFHEEQGRLQAREEAHRARATDEVLKAESDAGVRMTQAEVDHAVTLRMHGAHPLDAIENAKRSGEELGLQQNAEMQDRGMRRGVPSGTPQNPIPGVTPPEPPPVFNASDLSEFERGLYEQLNPVPPPPPATPNFSEFARAQLANANRLYALYKDRFRTGAVGEVLRPGARAGEFKLADVQVPGRLFRSGPAGGVAADGLIKAAGSREAALAILGDAPALSLRNYAMKDGVMDLKAWQRWRNSYAPTLEKFPEIAQRFSTAAQAQRTAEAAAIRGEQRLTAYQDSAAKYYLGRGEAGTDTQSAIEKLMASENPAAAAKDLMRQTGINRAAIDGIRRNTIEWLMTRARSTAEAGTTGEKAMAGAAFQKVVQNPKVGRALDAILTGDQRRVVDAVATDLEQAARAYNAVRVPGSPSTAADLEALGHGKAPSQLVQMWIGEKAGEFLGHLVMPGAGGLWRAATEAAGSVGGLYFNARRAAGMRSLEDLTTAGMLNPALGRVLLQRAVTDPKSPILRESARRMIAVATGAATQGVSR